MKNIIALAGMISILALAYVLDLLLSLAGLGFVEGVPEFFSRRNAWLAALNEFSGYDRKPVKTGCNRSAERA